MRRTGYSPFSANVFNQFMSAEAKNTLQPLIRERMIRQQQQRQASAAGGYAMRPGADTKTPGADTKTPWAGRMQVTEAPADRPTAAGAVQPGPVSPGIVPKGAPRADLSAEATAAGGAGASIQPASGKKSGGNADQVNMKLEFDNKGLLNGILLSEILGKPKCLRKGRW